MSESINCYAKKKKKTEKQTHILHKSNQHLVRNEIGYNKKRTDNINKTKVYAKICDWVNNFTMSNIPKKTLFDIRFVYKAFSRRLFEYLYLSLAIRRFARDVTHIGLVYTLISILPSHRKLYFFSLHMFN